jgi:uncharacterized membrane protein YeaQ/YmgE (transglycosylase-associated protein family)
MGIISWIVIGGLAGWIASMIMDTDKSMGVMANIIVGIIGGLIGGFVVSIFGGAGMTGFNVWSLVVAVIGSIILLAIVKAARGGSKA